MTAPTPRPTARLQAAARRLADQNSRRLADVPAARMFRATITDVVAGAGGGGGARVTVTWRGAEVTIADYPDSYTPALGHRVLCALVDNQASILHRGIGYPT